MFLLKDTDNSFYISATVLFKAANALEERDNTVILLGKDHTYCHLLNVTLGYLMSQDYN